MTFPCPPGLCCRALVVLFLLTAAVAAAPPGSEPGGGKYWAFVGTYTQKGSKGIYRFVFDPATGKLTEREVVAEASNPTFLALSPDQRFLYAVSEIDDFEGKKTGAIAGFAVDARTGNLTPLNRQPSGGTGPCHLVVDRLGKHVLAANYGSGSTSVLPIDSDGRLGPATDVRQHKGSSVNKSRQEGPHAHCVTLDAANRFAFVCDLGLDKILIYRYDAEKGKLTPNDPPAADVAPGAGPRHFAFHPNGRFGYVTNEMACTVTAFVYDPDRGTLKELQTIPTFPGGPGRGDSTAEIEVHPSGKFLYDSNRGHDTISVFRVDEKSGELTRTGEQGHEVKEPRHFAIDPTGKYLLVGNQNSDSIVVFRIDAKTGELTPAGPKADVPTPVCTVLMPIKR
jgi:6-phosphogluconolactonase